MDVESQENSGEVKTIAVIGANAEGRRIALASILAGFQTVLEDVSRQSLERAFEWIRRQLEESAGPAESLSLLILESRIEDAIRDADLIIEAVPDELEMKLELFTIFDKFAKPGAIFASTSATLSVGDFTDVTLYRERCIGMRFLNSPKSSNAIELSRAPLTSDETVVACQEVALRLANEVFLRTENPEIAAKNAGSAEVA
jgi:3-hydroxybutyryl-CoA dehydrogenase